MCFCTRKFSIIPFPGTIKLRIIGLFRTRKNSCRTCHYEVKCRKALWLQAHDAIKRTQSSESRFYLCKKYYQWTIRRDTIKVFLQFWSNEVQCTNANQTTWKLKGSAKGRYERVRLFGGLVWIWGVRGLVWDTRSTEEKPQPFRTTLDAYGGAYLSRETRSHQQDVVKQEQGNQHELDPAEQRRSRRVMTSMRKQWTIGSCDSWQHWNMYSASLPFAGRLFPRCLWHHHFKVGACVQCNLPTQIWGDRGAEKRTTHPFQTPASAFLDQNTGHVRNMMCTTKSNT